MSNGDMDFLSPEAAAHFDVASYRPREKHAAG